MHAHWTKSLVPCGLCDSDEPFSFCRLWLACYFLFYCHHLKENELTEVSEFVFDTLIRKTGHLYSLLSLCKWNDYYLHCDSKCSCFVSLQFDLLTEELSWCSHEVPSCSLIYCGMTSPDHCSQSILLILSTAVFNFLQYKSVLFSFVCLLFH